jgi:hypothetical protein
MLATCSMLAQLRCQQPSIVRYRAPDGGDPAGPYDLGSVLGSTPTRAGEKNVLFLERSGFRGPCGSFWRTRGTNSFASSIMVVGKSNMGVTCLHAGFKSKRSPRVLTFSSLSAPFAFLTWKVHKTRGPRPILTSWTTGPSYGECVPRCKQTGPAT